MEFGLAQFTSVELSKKSNLVNSFSDAMKDFFYDKDYGEGLKSLFIGIASVSPQFEPFFKERKPKYTKDKKTIVSQATKTRYEIEKCLEYDVKVDFESFKSATEKEAEKILAKEILQSLYVLDDMKKKVKDFDSERFKSDLEKYFKDKELI